MVLAVIFSNWWTVLLEISLFWLLPCLNVFQLVIFMVSEGKLIQNFKEIFKRLIFNSIFKNLYSLSKLKVLWWYRNDDRFTSWSLLDVLLEIFVTLCHDNHFNSIFLSANNRGQQLSCLDSSQRHDWENGMATLVYSYSLYIDIIFYIMDTHSGYIKVLLNHNTMK